MVLQSKSFQYQDILAVILASNFIVVKFITWWEQIDINGVFITLGSIAGFVYLIMRIYDQYLVTKERKKNSNNTNNIIDL